MVVVVVAAAFVAVDGDVGEEEGDGGADDDGAGCCCCYCCCCPLGWVETICVSEPAVNGIRWVDGRQGVGCQQANYKSSCVGPEAD